MLNRNKLCTFIWCLVKTLVYFIKERLYWTLYGLDNRVTQDTRSQYVYEKQMKEEVRLFFDKVYNTKDNRLKTFLKKELSHLDDKLSQQYDYTHV